MSADPAVQSAPKPLPGGLLRLLGAPTDAEFDAALAAFGCELAPATMLETFLVEMILFAVRRLHRVQAVLAAAEAETPEHRRALTSAERSVWKALGELHKARRPARTKVEPKLSPATPPAAPAPEPPAPVVKAPARADSPAPPSPHRRPALDGVRRLERLLGDAPGHDLSALPTITPSARLSATGRP